jgi:hypothetical protein
MTAKSIPPISRVGSGEGGGVADGVGVGVGEAVGEVEGLDEAVATASGEDDGAELGAVADSHAAPQSRTTTRRPVLTRESLTTTWSHGPDFADEELKRYEFRGGSRCHHVG